MGNTRKTYDWRKDVAELRARAARLRERAARVRTEAEREAGGLEMMAAKTDERAEDLARRNAT